MPRDCDRVSALRSTTVLTTGVWAVGVQRSAAGDVAGCWCKRAVVAQIGASSAQMLGWHSAVLQVGGMVLMQTSLGAQVGFLGRLLGVRHMRTAAQVQG